MKLMSKLFTFLAVLAQLSCLRAQQTYHLLDIIPNQSGSAAGELRFIENTSWPSQQNYVGFKAPASISTNFVLTLPAALPGALSCLVADTAGVITFDPTCTGSGGLPVIDTTSIVEGSVDATKELRFEVDGFTTATVRVLTPQNADYTIAGTNIGQTFSGSNLFTNTNEFDSTVNMDSSLNIRTSGTLAMTIRSIATNRVIFENSVGSDELILDFGTDDFIVGPKATFNGTSVFNNTSTHTALVIAGSANPDLNNTRALGTSSLRYSNVFSVLGNFSGTMTTANINSSGTITADVALSSDLVEAIGASPGIVRIGTSGANGDISYDTTNFNLTFNDDLVATSISSTKDIGRSGARWGTVWATSFNASSGSTLSGGIDTGTSSTSTVHIGSTGNFFTRDTGGLSTSISCSGVNDGWLAITSDNYIVWCDGGARYRVLAASF